VKHDNDDTSSSTQKIDNIIHSYYNTRSNRYQVVDLLGTDNYRPHKEQLTKMLVSAK